MFGPQGRPHLDAFPRMEASRASSRASFSAGAGLLPEESPGPSAARSGRKVLRCAT